MSTADDSDGSPTVDFLESRGARLDSKIEVALSNELVRLLSEQLYQSPVKAIEELVVNAYDADADQCRVYVPSVDRLSAPGTWIAVFDDGAGMSEEGLADLWHIGRSNKRSEEVERRRKREQIGRFGIGKLATYTIANRLTYFSKNSSRILAVSIDFNEFREDPTGTASKLKLPVYQIASEATGSDPLSRVLARLDLDHATVSEVETWTLALLEDLKPKAQALRIGRLKWVLSTAMPLSADFALSLNGEAISSSKANFSKIVDFDISKLPDERLNNLHQSTGVEWTRDSGKLVSTEFPSGVSGTAAMTARTLSTGKSTDLGRSHGFFVRVRKRLINEDDGLFGLDPLSYKYFNRFYADVHADDLDEVLTAPREGVEDSSKKDVFQALLREVFNHVRKSFEDAAEHLAEAEKRKKEEQRNFVNPHLVELPLADTLVSSGIEDGAEADRDWFYVSFPHGESSDKLLAKLYDTVHLGDERPRYRYDYESLGKAERVVRFMPAESRFVLNTDHVLVQAHVDDHDANLLLEDMVTAEALLEVYLRENHVPPPVIGEVLERRDALLRSLAQDHPYSLKQLAEGIRDSAADQYDLELAVVSAARALGLVAKHLSGAGRADGVARFLDYERGEVQLITLEAKSSSSVPSLAAIDFAGLAEHVSMEEAVGCLLVAPSYPGESRGEASAAAERANELQISCWTTDLLARVVEQAEVRHVDAVKILEIVTTKFRPTDVEQAVEALLGEPSWSQQELYRATLRALAGLEPRLKGSPRNVSQVATEVSREADFEHVSSEEVRTAIRTMASASSGAMVLSGETIGLTTSLEELGRRLGVLTGENGNPLKPPSFR